MSNYKRNHRCQCGWKIPECIMVRDSTKAVYSSVATFIDVPGYKPDDPNDGKIASDIFVAFQCPECDALFGEDMMHGDLFHNVNKMADEMGKSIQRKSS